MTMAFLDVVVTQRCIATHQYREGNPPLPLNQGRSSAWISRSAWATG